MSTSTIQPISQLPGLSPKVSIPEPVLIPVQSIKQSVNQSINQNIKSTNEMSPAIAIIDDELACFYAVRYILRSHEHLTDDDTQYAANYISSFYAYNNEWRVNQNEFSREQLAMFLVYADRKGICKFALIFNEELDASIKNRDNTGLQRMLLGPKEMFIELYDNTFLESGDREFIIRLISREIFSFTMAFDLIKKQVLNLETIDDRCHSESFVTVADKKHGLIHMTSLTSKCYDEVCVQDARILEDDPARAAMSKYEKTPSSVYTIDKPATTTTPQVYCFSTLDLIAAVTEEVPINPKSNEHFSDYTLKLIHQRFRKEIAMYQCYKQLTST
jgi:hypothetical protein